MRKLILLTALTFGSVATFAQINSNMPFVKAKTLHKDYTQPSTITPSQVGPYLHNINNRNTNNIIWSEDFNGAIPTGWTAQTISGPNGWAWSNQMSQGQFAAGTGTVNSPTGNNGFMMLDADAHNTPGTAQTFQDITASLTSPAINIGNNNALLLRMYNYYRPFTDTECQVSVSADGINFTQVANIRTAATNSSSTNPQIDEVYVSCPLGTTNTIYLRFTWDGESHYFWQLDDIALCPAPNNDLVLEEDYFNTYQDSTQNTFYTMQPQNQAQFDTIWGGFAFLNLGGAAQPNVTGNLTVTGAGTYNKNSLPIASVGTCVNDSTNIEQQYDYFLASAAGNYNYNFAITSDSNFAEATPANNSLSYSVNVNDSVYARDDDNHSGLGIWYGGGTQYRAGVLYDIWDGDVATSISYYFQATTAAGSIIQPQIYDENLNPLLPTTTFITLGPNMIDQWITINIPNTTLNPGEQYLAAFESFSDSVLMAVTDDVEADPVTVLVDVNKTGQWGFTNFVPYIRLNVEGTVDPCNAPINPTVTNESCLGSSDGSISVSLIGASNFAWTGPGGFTGSGANITGLAPGTYTLTATGGGCTWTNDYTITGPSSLLTSATTSTNESCGSGDATATATPAGGQAPYFYSWSDGQTGQTAMNLNAGTYTVTVSDLGGCTSTSTVSVSGTPGVVANPTITFVNCGAADGGIAVNVTSGTAPYNYSWQGPVGIGNTATPNNLPVGTYNVTVTDANACTNTYSISLTNQNPPVVSGLFINDPACFGQTNGSITVNIVGGTGVYTYAWTGPSGFNASTQNISNLSQGVYSLTVTDAVGCVGNYVDTLTEPTQVVATSASVDVTCNGDNDGSISLNVSGGISPYTANWTGPGFNGSGLTINNLVAGTYIATILDDNNCTVTETVTLTEPSAIVVAGTVVDNQAIGSISINITGGNGPYTTVWEFPDASGSTSEDLTGLTLKGTYSVTVTDANNCTTVQTFNVGGVVSVNSIAGQTFDLNIYPNPNNGTFQVAFENAPNGNYRLELRNVIGQIVHLENAAINGSQTHTINLESFTPGMYFLNVTGAQSEVTYKVILK